MTTNPAPPQAPQRGAAVRKIALPVLIALLEVVIAVWGNQLHSEVNTVTIGFLAMVAVLLVAVAANHGAGIAFGGAGGWLKRAWTGRWGPAAVVGILSWSLIAAVYLYPGTDASTPPGPQPTVGPPGSTAPTATGTPPHSPSTADCTDKAAGAAHPLPKVETASGLVFCPTLINNGQLPVTGRFSLAGTVLGPLEERQRVVLLDFMDQTTCDALGNPPAPGAFYMAEADIGSADGSWSTPERQGYDEAVTIRRVYKFVRAKQESIDAIKNDRAHWGSQPGNKAGDYPGILALPGDAQVLASFEVPPGLYKGKTGVCKQ